MSRVHVFRVHRIALQQLAGLEKNPHLAKGLPVPPKRLRAEHARLLALGRERKRVFERLKLLREREQDQAFRVRELVNQNIDDAVGRLGRYSPDLVYLGAKPLGGGRRRRRKHKGKEDQRS